MSQNGGRWVLGGSPGLAPRRGFPGLGDVDGLAGDLAVLELEDADRQVPRPAVVADRVLRHPEVAGAPDLTDLEGQDRRVHASPLAEVLDAVEAFAGLGE